MISSRAKNIQPFRVMSVVQQAQRLAEQGHQVLHLEVGEPNFSTPTPVSQVKNHGYSAALGILPLRQAIAKHYQQRYQLDIDARRIVITTGGSGALQLLTALLVEPGSGVMMPDPCYPCNRQFVQLMGGQVQSVVMPAQSGGFSAQAAAQHWQSNTQLMMLASPENPTGAVMPVEQMAELVALAKQRKANLIVDEIYQGWVYDEAPDYSALTLSDDIFVVNSFSKFFGMTGWRLGWIVAPQWSIDYLEKLTQNIFICAPTATQYTALNAFNEQTLAQLELHRNEFARRRNYLLPALQKLGLQPWEQPEGAFYIYGDISAWSDSSEMFAQQLLQHKHVATTPGTDFSPVNGHKTLRFAYTADMAVLKNAVQRIAAFI